MKKQLNNQEMITFCSQMALVLHSGISSYEGISMLMEDQKNKSGREVLEQIYQEMELGNSLYKGMRKTEVFPDYACQMVQLGETSGRLDETMRALSEYYNKEENMYQTIRRAVAYPLFMLSMMLVVLLVLIIKVMPIFNQVFLSLGTQMDGAAGVILRMGETLGRYSGVFLVILLAALAFFFWITKTERGRKLSESWVRRSRFTRKLTRKTAQYRLASGMSMCIQSGLNPESSLELMAKLVENEEECSKIRFCISRISEGTPFEEAMLESELFDGIHNRMLRIGQRTGAMDQVMGEIGSQCEKEASEQIWHRIDLIEPTIVIVLAVLVGTILMSVMLPLMSIMSEIG
ncbi:MAG: type II secretion system F family protein [Lachnospiraceae bacterium]|nr:type II secretion system F family protein [Lachnospiraceae bacterium]